MNRLEQPESSTSRILIREEYRNGIGIPLCYRLLICESDNRPRFYISVSSDSEESEIDVGCDLLRALRYFRRILRGSVTPCTLKEIGEDLHYFENF